MSGNVIPGACDCHVHVVGPLGRFPQTPRRTYTAGLATLESLRAASGPCGVTRFVIVQASFYGSDNACLLETLDTLGDCGRGVAVIDPATATPELLGDYARRGVCGVRVNLYSTVSQSAAPHSVGAVLESWFSRLPRSGWHVEIIAPLDVLDHAAQTIARSPVPVVLDHYGLPGAVSPDSAEGRVLLDLARLPHVWFKLSGPYRVLADPLATAPPAAWLRALVEAAPDRCVWGSDWPHTPARDDQMAAGKPAAYRKFPYAELLGQFIDALADPALAKQILADNPARLYGFPSGC